MNYQVTIKSRLGSRSEILEKSRAISVQRFEGILDALDFINRQSTVNGWRDFSLETIATQAAKPLRAKQEAAA